LGDRRITLLDDEGRSLPDGSMRCGGVSFDVDDNLDRLLLFR